MRNEIKIGIQGKGSSTITDIGILGRMIKDDLGVNIIPVTEDDYLTRLDWLKQGKIDLLYESSYTPIFNEGKTSQEINPFRCPIPLHIAISAHSGAFGFMVRGDSPIHTIYDIGPTTSITAGNERTWALLAWLKMYEGSLDKNPAAIDWKANLVDFHSWENSLRALPEGKVDVALATPQNPIVKEAALRPPGIRFLELPKNADPAGAERFLKVFPFSSLVPAPEDGVKEIWGVTTMVGHGCIFCLPDFDTELEYKLTRWLDQNYPIFKDKGNKLNTYTLESLCQTVETAMAPIHEGTRRYLKETGFWQDRHDRRNEYYLKLAHSYLMAWRETMETAKLDPALQYGNYKKWEGLWLKQKAELAISPYQRLTDSEIENELNQPGLKSIKLA